MSGTLILFAFISRSNSGRVAGGSSPLRNIAMAAVPGRHFEGPCCKSTSSPQCPEQVLFRVVPARFVQPEDGLPCEAS